MTQRQLRAMANRIKARRSALKFTQERFAELIDITVSSYTKIENAFQKPSLDTLMQIAERLNLSLDYLVYGREDGKPLQQTEDDLIQALISYADPDKLLHASEILQKIALMKPKETSGADNK